MTKCLKEKDSYQFKNNYEVFATAVFFIWLILCGIFVGTFGALQVTGKIIFILVLIVGAALWAFLGGKS